MANDNVIASHLVEAIKLFLGFEKFELVQISAEENDHINALLKLKA